MDHSTMVMPAGIEASGDPIRVFGLLPLLALPLVALAAATALRLAGRANLYRRLAPSARLAVLGMLSTAGLHLSLVPEHMGESPLLGASFLLAGAALLALAIAAVTPAANWAPLAALVIGVMVIGYAYTRIAGVEPWDVLGLLDKAIELATLSLLLHTILFPLRSRLSSAGAGSGA